MFALQIDGTPLNALCADTNVGHFNYTMSELYKVGSAMILARWLPTGLLIVCAIALYYSLFRSATALSNGALRSSSEHLRSSRSSGVRSDRLQPPER